jgi:hypothetical protein
MESLPASNGRPYDRNCRGRQLRPAEQRSYQELPISYAIKSTRKLNSGQKPEPWVSNSFLSNRSGEFHRRWVIRQVNR